MPYPMTDKSLAEFEQGVPPIRRSTKRRAVLALSGALARAAWLLDRASVRVLNHLPPADHSGRNDLP